MEKASVSARALLHSIHTCALGRSKRLHTCGAACDCAAGSTQWGHSSVKVVCGCDCIQTYSEIKI